MACRAGIDGRLGAEARATTSSWARAEAGAHLGTRHTATHLPLEVVDPRDHRLQPTCAQNDEFERGVSHLGRGHAAQERDVRQSFVSRGTHAAPRPPGARGRYVAGADAPPIRGGSARPAPPANSRAARVQACASCAGLRLQLAGEWGGLA